jgi:hypothetical protein
VRLRVPVAGVLIRGFTAARAVEEYRRDSPRLLREIGRKLLLRTEAILVSSVAPGVACSISPPGCDPATLNYRNAM